MSDVRTETALKPVAPNELRKELALEPPAANLATQVTIEAGLDSKADEYVRELLNFTPNDDIAKESRKSAVETMGLEAQKRASGQSALLKNPIMKMSQRTEEGGDVANSLINLKVKVEELDPAKFNFEAGWATRMLGFLPGIGTPLKKYFSKYESAQTVIDAIIRSLEVGRDQLGRDNITLGEDQKRMRELTRVLEDTIGLARAMDQKIQYRLEREIPESDPKHKFVQEELLFPLRQRILDLQQQLAVTQQGILAMEVIIRNNKELMRGVNRALNVTVSALETAVTVAMALAEQKIVLDKVQALNSTTNDLIANTAKRLKTQGVEIHKSASSTQLNMDVLKVAFQDITSAMDDISKFRREALPQMASTILEMNSLTDTAEKAVRKMEEGNQKQLAMKFEV